MLTVTPATWQVPARPRDRLPKAVFRTETGLKTALPPFWYYYTTRHPKGPYRARQSPSGRAGKSRRRTCNGLPTSGHKKGAALADYPFVNYILQAASLVKSSYKRTHYRFDDNRNRGHAPNFSSQNNVQEVHSCHRRYKYHMPVGKQNR